MLQVPYNFKLRVQAALLEYRGNFDGSDAAFAKQFKISANAFSRLKKGETENIIRPTQWINVGRELNIALDERQWNTARTDVFTIVEEDILFCKEYSKAKIFVDEAEIGKTYSAKYLSRKIRNCFYVDASQAKTKIAFIKLLAKSIGIDDRGTFTDIKENIKYYLKMLPQPLVIIDEAGDLEYPAFLNLKELWNATENACGWYMIGADGLRSKIEKGIREKKVGYTEIFSRYSSNYTVVTPASRPDKVSFYKKLITDVLSVNMRDKNQLNTILHKCLTHDVNGKLGGLRRAESLLILNQA